MRRENPPMPVSNGCAIAGCPLPPGCGQRCFIHDRMHMAAACDEATHAILQLDPIFRCAERMSNAAPGDPIPSETRKALAQRCEGLTMPKGMTSRQCAQALRAWLLKQCRPAAAGPSMTVADRMQAEGLRPIGELVS